MSHQRFRYTRYALSEKTIAEHAAAWRKAGGLTGQNSFDITKFISGTLVPKLSKSGKRLTLALTERAMGDPACVTHNPLTLHCDIEIWSDARMHEPHSKGVLAHEIAHVLFHDNYENLYSAPGGLGQTFADPDHDVENHAWIFTDHFLVPDEIALAHGDARSIVSQCAVEPIIADRAMQRVNRLTRKPITIAGDICPKCFNFSITYNNGAFRCSSPGC